MKSYSSREVIKLLEEDGWYHVSSVGDHWHFKHPTNPAKVTVTRPVRDIPVKTLRSIRSQS